MSGELKSRKAAYFGIPWVCMCSGLALHIWDEAAHGFLDYYNATVLAFYGHFSWFPRMDWQFKTWLATLISLNLLLFLLTPLAFRNVRWLRSVAYVIASLLFLNGIAHILVALRGYTVPSVRFDGPAPGVYSAPLLLLVSTYLFWALRLSRGRATSN